MCKLWVGGWSMYLSGQTTTEEEAEEVSKGGKKVEHQQRRQQTCYKYVWQEQKSECQRSINNIFNNSHESVLVTAIITLGSLVGNPRTNRKPCLVSCRVLWTDSTAINGR